MVQSGLADCRDMTLGYHQAGDGRDEGDEGEERADGQEKDSQDQAQHGGHRTDDHGAARTDAARLDVSTETGVALELFFDLSQNALFIL